jgi:hypothetical protein
MRLPFVREVHNEYDTAMSRHVLLNNHEHRDLRIITQRSAA